MRCLYACVIMVLIVASIDAHLHRNRIEHHPFVPIVPQNEIIDPFFSRPPGLLGGGISPQAGIGLPNFGQTSQFNNQQTWNNGVPSTQFDRNGINSNVLSSTDPWEQYRRFNSGMQSLSGGRQSTTTNSISTPNQFIPGTINNSPWNTFANQNSFGTNIPTIPNNQGFVNPQFQNQGFLSQGFPNNQFQNQGFLSQGFPNNQLQNQGFLAQGFPNNQLQNQGFLSQGFPNNQFQNQGFLSQGFPNNNQFQNQGSLTQG